MELKRHEKPRVTRWGGRWIAVQRLPLLKPGENTPLMYDANRAAVKFAAELNQREEL